MSIIFAILGLLFLLAILAIAFFLVLFLARKAGFLVAKTDNKTTNELQVFWAYLKTALLFRFVLIALLVFLMLLPLDMITKTVDDRRMQYHSVLTNIAKTWGQQQKISGPALLIPYTEKHITRKVIVQKDGTEQTVNKTSYSHHTAIVLPESLDIQAHLNKQQRKRSIYNALVYSADLKIKGHFLQPNIAGLSSSIDQINWDKAWLVLGLSDTQAINRISTLQWSSQQAAFEPGTRITHYIKNGFHAPLKLNSKGTQYTFSLDLNVNGSEGFYFEPFGKTTKVKVSSDWPHPSFQGSVLPKNHDINDQGFSATWIVPHLARNYPQIWSLQTENFNIHKFVAGVNLFEPVTLYSKITRAIKYAALFIGLIYIIFLIFELAIKRSLHLFQYTLIGLAMSLFYLTLLSLAEHIAFLNAYLISTTIIVLMISLYVHATLRKISQTALIAGLLSSLYGFLYILLRLEDFALLVGTGLLILVLAVVMYLTRKTGT